MFLKIALVCASTMIINESDHKWNDNDQAALKTAKKSCAKDYPESPCLKKFIKKGEKRYWAICSQKTVDKQQQN